MSKTKLPKFWISLHDDSAQDVVEFDAGKPAKWYHLYAPVEKPKVCRWTPCMSNEGDASYKDTGCGDHLSGVVDRFKWCPYCGGKIVVSEGRK